MQDQSFEEQFRMAVRGTTQPVKVRRRMSSAALRIPLMVCMIAGVVCAVVGFVLTMLNVIEGNNGGHKTTIAELSSKTTELRAEEGRVLESSGFGDAFYEALGKSSGVMDEIYEAEDAVAANKEKFGSVWQYLTGKGAIYYFGGAVVMLAIGGAMILIVKKKMPGAVGVVPVIVGICVFGSVAVRADFGSGGAIASVSLAEFAADTDYVNKLVPGSDDPNAADYYAKPSFQNSEASHAVFEVAGGRRTEIYEDEVGFECDVMGVKNYMVDFTGADKSFTNFTRSASVDVNSLDTRSRAVKAAMLQNTLYLQLTEYCAQGRSITITIPKGEYYFAVGHRAVGRNADGSTYVGSPYVILPVDGVNISGRGIGEYKSAIATVVGGGNVSVIDAAGQRTDGSNATILLPFTRPAYNSNAAPDMFRFNEYADSNYTDARILRNISYRDFIVDGKDAVGKGYTSAGKGFMYNVFSNVNWDNMVVKNTDGTGFGVDCPIGSGNYITNSLAMNNGKKATASDGGASGFGIGVGYRDDEMFNISRSVAYGNTKFGFFFEHQNRFKSPAQDNFPYDAIAGAGSAPWLTPPVGAEYTTKAFKVSDSASVSNLYNYGGLRAYDMSVTNSKSVAGSVSRNAGTYYAQETTTVNDIYYSSDSRRVKANGVGIKGEMPEDVRDSSKWYYQAVKWAYENGITYGVSGSKFGTGQQMRRSDALIIIWRMMGEPGEVVTKKNGNQSVANPKDQNVQTCFDDIAPNSYYAGAIRWAYYDRYNPSSPTESKGRITLGTRGCSGESGGEFSPNKIVTRAEFVTMLWRLAGEPAAGGTMKFTDVPEDAYYSKAAKWAVANGITQGVGNNKFAPDSDCTREQAVTFLYRYYQKYGRS